MLHSPSGNNVLSGPPKLIALDFLALPGSQATTSRLGRLTLSQGTCRTMMMLVG